MITKDEFLKDISNHQLTVLRYDGIYRHIRCAKPGTGVNHFEIITWPGYLAYVGDRGSYTFKRINDMFGFFGRDDGEINPEYWAEKIVATSDEDSNKYTTRYTWCCYAIVWSINKFREWEQAKGEEFLLALAKAAEPMHKVLKGEVT